MKKCPFCAEEIQDEALKCKHCGSSLAGGAQPRAAAGPAPAGAAAAPHPDDPKVMLFEGSPSWRAYFGSYALVVLCTPVVLAIALWATIKLDTATLPKLLAVLIPLAAGAIAFVVVTFVRKRVRVRVSNRNVEYESGLLSKRIDVLELWRVKDVRYRQSLLDRILGVAHIDVYTKDVTSPQLALVGLPASRAVFEKLRDAIELQRQSKRVIGVMD